MNIIEYGEGMKESKKTGEQKEFKYILMELAAGGSLQDHITVGGRFEEPHARFLFK